MENITGWIYERRFLDSARRVADARSRATTTFDRSHSFHARRSMSSAAPPAEHGVHLTVRRLTESLRSYIEAQYHIRNESLIRERRQLLEESGAVAQLPFVESTPVYE